MKPGDLTSLPAPQVCVAASILAVPNGVAANGDMLVGLQISPIPAIAASGKPTYDLLNWPAQIQAALPSLTLHVAGIQSTGELETVSTYAGKISCDTSWSPREAAIALKLWQANFGIQEAQHLVDALTEDMGGQKRMAGAARLAPLVDTEAISSALRATYFDRVAGEFSRRAVAPVKYDKLIEDLTYWAPPGIARDELGIAVDKFERNAQLALWRAAMHAANPAFVGLSGDNEFSVAKARAQLRVQELDGVAHPNAASVIDAVAKASRQPFHDILEELALVTSMLHRAQLSLPDPTPKEIARRKLASILSCPTIATFLGMNVEVRIAQSDWQAMSGALSTPSYGAIAVTLDPARPPSQGWTAFVHGGRAGPSFFGPCDKAEALAHGPSPDAEIEGGVVKLRRALEDGTARYSLDVIDVVPSTERQQEFARRKLAALRRGDPVTDSEPNLVGRGLTLVDKQTHPAEVVRASRARRLEADPSASVNYASDLLHGYRVMIAIPEAGTAGYKSTPARWRTVMARTLTFKSGRQVDRGFVARCVAPEREFGIVKSIPVEQITINDKGQPQQMLLPTQEMFSWHGDSQTVSAPSEKVKAQALIDSSSDFAVSRTYHLPESPRAGGYDYRPTPLREGYPYLVGLAASYVGGWGLGVQDAAKAHADDSCGGHVLGGNDGNPLVFRRPDKIPAPAVLLPADCRLVKASAKANLLGETLMTLVVRSTDRGIRDGECRRFLFPHSVDFDRAAQQGQFRGVREANPSGAFRSHVGILWARGGGGFPLAVGGRVVTSLNAVKKESRGPVLHFQGDPSPRQQYYPDAYSQYLRTHLVIGTPADAAIPASGKPLGFWRDGQAPRQAMPVLLELRAVPRSARKARIAIDGGRPETIMGAAGPVRVLKITISMQPATKISAQAVAEPSIPSIIRRHLIGDALAAVVRSEAAAAVASLSVADLSARRLEVLLSKGVVSALNGLAELTLVHAQQRPAAPQFVGGDTELTPVVVTVAPEGQASTGRTWPQVVAARRAAFQDQYRHWPSEEGGATCFFVGRVQVDPAVTGVLRCEAEWQEHGPQFLKRVRPKDGRSSSQDHVSYKAGSGNGILFSIDDIDSATTATTLDLLGTKPRALAHAFPDGKARRLTTRLIATSRFVEYFDRPKDCERTSRAFPIWVPCTFLPPPPTVDRINPVFDYDYRSNGRDRISFTRTSRLRVELGDDPYLTGEGEQMAVLFRGTGTDPCDLFTPELEPYADGFTRQGRDPLHQSPVLGVITPARLRSGGLPRTGSLKAERTYYGAASNDEGVEVVIVPHPLKLDEEKGFYCDIELDPRNARERALDLASGQAAYMPFVHLGLARYQEHAVDGLQLSHAVGRDVQLLPWRHGSIQFEGLRKFTVRVEGPMVDEDPGTAPRLEITVVRAHGPAGTRLWVPAAGPADDVHCGDRSPKIEHGRAIWEWTGNLPHSRKTHHYGIRIQELERQRISTEQRYRNRDNIFSMTIDLRMRRTRLPVEIVVPVN